MRRLLSSIYDRKDCNIIKLLLLFVLNLLSPLLIYVVAAPSFSIFSSGIEHNVVEEGKNGMKVTISFFANEVKGCKVDVHLYVTYPNGGLVPATQTSYSQDGRGAVDLIRLCTPGYDCTRYDDFVFFLPYEAIKAPEGAYVESVESYLVKTNFYLYNTDGSLNSVYPGSSDQFCVTWRGTQTSQQQVSTNPMDVLNNIISNPGAYMQFDFSGVPPASNVTPSSSGSAKQRHECYVCKATGRVEKMIYDPGDFKYCAECRRERPAGHYHSNCDNCYGTGYVEY